MMAVQHGVDEDYEAAPREEASARCNLTLLIEAAWKVESEAIAVVV